MKEKYQIPITKQISAIFTGRRVAKGLTIEEVADKLEVPRFWIVLIEACVQHNIPLGLFWRLTIALDIPFDIATQLRRAGELFDDNYDNKGRS